MTSSTPGSEDQPALEYLPSADPAAMWDRDLTEQQQRWEPVTADDLWNCVLPWRCERTVERIDGRAVDVIMLTEGAGPPWDWRTVAYWTAMLGATWRVHLRNGARCDLIAPRQPEAATADDAAISTLKVSSPVRGSRVLVTDTGTAIRGWLLANVDGSRLPLALRLVGQTYGEEMTSSQAHDAVNRDGTHLHQRLMDLAPGQLHAVAEQDGDEVLGHELLDRVLRYWDRPRLYGVDWTRASRALEVVSIPRELQNQDWTLSPGDKVMVAGDGFLDVHGTVVSQSEEHWRVRLRWEAWEVS